MCFQYFYLLFTKKFPRSMGIFKWHQMFSRSYPKKTLHEMPWFVSPCCSLRIGIELQHWKDHAKSCERSTRGQLWGSHFQAAAPMGQRLLQFKSDKHKAIMSAYKEMLIEMFWPQSWKAVNENMSMFVSCLNYLFFLSCNVCIWMGISREHS